MSLEDLTDKIREKVAHSGAALNARVKFDLGDDGCIFVDATQTPATVSNDDEDADTTLVCSMDVFEKLMTGQQDPNIAFLMGKLKIQGSMGLALKLNSFLED